MHASYFPPFIPILVICRYDFGNFCSLDRASSNYGGGGGGGGLPEHHGFIVVLFESQ
jgi:hypothetical protein